MKSLLIAVVIVLLAGSTASGGWPYAAPAAVPAPVVYPYWPVGPVYAYPPPVVRLPVRAVYPRPVIAPAPAVYPYPVVGRAPVMYVPPVWVRSKVYFRGRPVRNAIRAALP